MTGLPQQQADRNDAGDLSQYKYFKAVNNKHGVRKDLEALCKFVRDFLFYVIIHDARGSGTNPNDELMGENGKASDIYIRVFLRDKEKISNVELVESTQEEKEQYLKYLWKEGLRTKGKYNIRKALSNEKSAVYAGISESFKSRHNRDLWKKAIRENKGMNNMRFGPPIFEAHVRTTVRENYFKWIFQQLSDVIDVADEEVEAFQMEYDEHIYTDLPQSLVCTHERITRFPYKNCEITYGKVASSTEQDDEDDIGSYCSANCDQQPDASPNPAAGDSLATVEKKFILVYKNVDSKKFNDLREQQRKDMKNIIEKAREKHKGILESLKTTINDIRKVKREKPDTDPHYKVAVAEAKKELRLFKDEYEEYYSEGPVQKKRRKSIENQTRFSDSKVTFFYKTKDDMKREEEQGLRKSWEALYKEVWNKHLLVPKHPVIDTPVPQVNSIVRDMEFDVNQLLADCAGMVEQV